MREKGRKWRKPQKRQEQTGQGEDREDRAGGREGQQHTRERDHIGGGDLSFHLCVPSTQVSARHREKREEEERRGKKKSDEETHGEAEMGSEEVS